MTYCVSNVTNILGDSWRLSLLDCIMKKDSLRPKRLEA
jgi:hypothetical protein